MSDIDDIVRLHVHGTLDPADSLGSFISENAAIVRELAERGPVMVHGGDTCAFCYCFRYALGDAEAYLKPEHHEPTCLWRRARALYPGD